VQDQWIKVTSWSYGFISVIPKSPQTEWVVSKMVSGILTAFFLFHQALLLNFQNRPGGHVYLEGHAYLALKSSQTNKILLMLVNLNNSTNVELHHTMYTSNIRSIIIIAIPLQVWEEIMLAKTPLQSSAIMCIHWTSFTWVYLVEIPSPVLLARPHISLLYAHISQPPPV